ncbi:hypothetical protein D6777_04135 [Candidatus Woesearchaeota archaeon]|nr:MAG: hypothetical protein D6777_04135 [Candidatus Woesearchaeota archaeon]
MFKKALALGVFVITILALIVGYYSPMSKANQYSNNSPSDVISEGQILVYENKVILNKEGIYWVRYADTDSMKPVLDENANGLEIVPKSEDEIKVGDIVSYQAVWQDKLVVHRVVDKGKDAFGTYFILKGDNNDEVDPGKVRFSQIKFKTIAIIY